jgi:hypothetical protein
MFSAIIDVMSTKTTKPSVFFIVVMIVMLLGLLFLGEEENEAGVPASQEAETAQPEP